MPDPAAEPIPPKTKRSSWALRWSLRAFVALISLACIVFALFAHWMRQGQIHEDVAANVLPMGGEIAWKLTHLEPLGLEAPQKATGTGSGVVIGHIDFEVKGGPAWMRNLGVEQAFQRIEHIWLFGPSEDQLIFEQPKDHLDDFLREVARLSEVKGVGICNVAISEGQIEWLLTHVATTRLTVTETPSIGSQPMPFLRDSNLTEIVFANTGLSDAVLDDLPDTLNYLDISDTKVTDQGLEHLVRLKNLKRVVIDQTATSKAAIEKLRKEMPWCDILWEPMLGG